MDLFNIMQQHAKQHGADDYLQACNDQWLANVVTACPTEQFFELVHLLRADVQVLIRLAIDNQVDKFGLFLSTLYPEPDAKTAVLDKLWTRSSRSLLPWIVQNMPPGAILTQTIVNVLISWRKFDLFRTTITRLEDPDNLLSQSATIYEVFRVFQFPSATAVFLQMLPRMHHPHMLLCSNVVFPLGDLEVILKTMHMSDVHKAIDHLISCTPTHNQLLLIMKMMASVMRHSDSERIALLLFGASTAVFHAVCNLGTVIPVGDATTTVTGAMQLLAPHRGAFDFDIVQVVIRLYRLRLIRFCKVGVIEELATGLQTSQQITTNHDNTWTSFTIWTGLEVDVSGLIAFVKERQAEARLETRLPMLRLLRSVWDSGAPTSPALRGLFSVLPLRRVCRTVKGHGLVEPFGQAVVAFL